MITANEARSIARSLERDDDFLQHFMESLERSIIERANNGKFTCNFIYAGLGKVNITTKNALLTELSCRGFGYKLRNPVESQDSIFISW